MNQQGRQRTTNLRNPVSVADLRKGPFRFGRPDPSPFKPLERNDPPGDEIVLSGDFLEFRVQGDVRAIARERLQKTAETKRGSVQDTVLSVGVVEAIAEGSIRVC